MSKAVDTTTLETIRQSVYQGQPNVHMQQITVQPQEQAGKVNIVYGIAGPAKCATAHEQNIIKRAFAVCRPNLISILELQQNCVAFAN